MSASEMKRLTALYSTPKTPAEVPTEITDWWKTYRPKMPRETWQAIRSDVWEVFERSDHRTLEFWKRLASQLSAYLGWRHETGRSTRLVDAMAFREIDVYMTRGYTGSKTSANSVRSRLRKLAENVNPSEQNLPGPVYSHPAVKPPYTLEQQARICRAVLRHRSGPTRTKLCLIVGLGLGAGVDPADFRYLCGIHIHDLGDTGIRGDIPGPKARTVWVRADHEHIVREGLAGLGDHRKRLIGGKSTDRNSVGRIIENARFHGAVPHIDTGRLRSTWLTWTLQQNLPLPVIMQAAGLKGARTLAELVEYLPVPDVGGEVLR